MNLQFKLAWRYLTGRKLRTFLTTLAVVFGVMIVFGMNIILPSMLAAFEANALAAGNVVDVTITHKTSGTFPADVANQLNGIDGIRAYSPLLARTVNLPADYVDKNPGKTDIITAVSLVGIDPEKAQSVHAYIILEGGRFLKAGDTDAAVITQRLADAYGVGLGDKINLPSVNGDTPLTVVGLLLSEATPGNEEVLVTQSQAGVMTGQAGQINTIEITLTSIEEARRAEIVSKIESTMGSNYQVGALSVGTDMFASLKLGQQAMNMFGVLALFMGGFIIFNTFRTVVAERRRDIGMLRALGAKRATITGMILVEGLVQGLLGSAIGLVFGYLMGAGILRLAQVPLSTFLHLNFSNVIVSPSLVVTSIILGVGVTVLAGLLPARKAARVTPMDALRPSVAEVEYKRHTGISFIIGLVLTALAIVALISGNMGLIALGSLLFLAGLILISPGLLRPIAYVFGKLTAALYARQGTGELAQGNLTRQPARVVITASASMIGIAIIVALGGLASSADSLMSNMTRKSLGSDYLFMPPSISVWNSDIGAGPEFVQRLRAIPGVGEISTQRFAGSVADGQALSLLGIDPVAYPQVSGLDFKKGDPTRAFEALAAGQNIIVNGSFAAFARTNLGDTVQLMTQNGSRPYKVVGIASDLLNAKVNTGYISQANMAADFGVTQDVFIQMNLKPGTTLESVDKQVKAVAADYPQFTVYAGKAYIDQMLKLVKVVFVGMYFLLAFLALPSLIAMLNTLAISVIERTREIGMLRAVGATRQQVGRMITAEALLLAAVGTAFGLCAGLYLGYVIVQGMAEMFPVQYSFPIAGSVAAIVIGLLFGLLAAIIPTRQATRLQVVEALRYE
jgi:putative ABC transport system permease protein